MIAPRDSDLPPADFHTSPDGQLALSIASDLSGETIIGFHGFDWAMEASHLAEASGLSLLEATQQFVRDILEDRSIIAILTVDGDVEDIWITEHPQSDLEQCTEAEELSFRYWSGKPFSPS